MKILFIIFAFANVHAANVEIVQSVPLETMLAAPGIRHAQEVWLEMIGAAKSTLDLEQFYVSDKKGEALEPVLRAIEDAARRGVRVRLLADTKFYKNYPESIDRIGKTRNCEARLVDGKVFGGGVQHAKFFIVDGMNSFVGSHNFDWRALSHIHEIGVRVNDIKVASDLKAIFEKDWNSGRPVGGLQNVEVIKDLKDAVTATETAAPGVEATVVAAPLAANPHGIMYSGTAIVDLMSTAGKTLHIQVMEYSTKDSWNLLDSAIRAAAGRGVKVRLLIDVAKLKNARKELEALAAQPGITVRTAKIPPWSGGVIDYARLIHSKYLVVDGAAAWVGTENWSKDYFTRSRDVGIVIRAKDAAVRLDGVFERIWQSKYVQDLKP